MRELNHAAVLYRLCFREEHASFEAVLAHYNLQLVGRGKDRAVLCPFHRERKASCKIELQRKVFHCFGCEAKGNILELVARMEGDPNDLRAAAVKVAAICKVATAPPRQCAGKSAGTAAANRNDHAPAKPAPVNDNKGPKATDAAVPGSARNPPAPGPVNPPLTFALKLDPEHPY